MNLCTTSDCTFASARHWFAPFTSHSRHARSTKPSDHVFQILLLSSGTTYMAEVISGWQLSEACFDDPHSCEATHIGFENSHDVLNILRILDKVREGFFQVVLVLPPAATRSGHAILALEANPLFALVHSHGVVRTPQTPGIYNWPTTTDQWKSRRGSQNNPSSVLPGLHSFTSSQKIWRSCQVRPGFTVVTQGIEILTRPG